MDANQLRTIATATAEIVSPHDTDSLEEIATRLGDSTLEHCIRVSKIADLLVEHLNPTTRRYVDPKDPRFGEPEPEGREPLNDNHSMLLRLGDLRDLVAAVREVEQ